MYVCLLDAVHQKKPLMRTKSMISFSTASVEVAAGLMIEPRNDDVKSIMIVMVGFVDVDGIA